MRTAAPLTHVKGLRAAAFDSQIDGAKMAWSCAIYVRLSAQGERLAMKLCGERAALLKIKSPCKLVVEP